NLTPMIDVLFLLIIFFMVGTKFVGDERKIQLKIPTVQENAQLQVTSHKKVVSISRDGQVTLDGELLTLEGLTSALDQQRQAQPHLSVSVRGSAESPFQHVASVLSACRAAGIQDMAIAVKMR
ncbi:MAG: biopolymer transporter ExbD, partial [Planctomycetota bacterium]